MASLFSAGKIYTALLLFSPFLIIVSWLNMYARNFNYEFGHYMLTFFVPAFLLSYAFSILFGEQLARRYKFTFKKVAMTLIFFYLFFQGPLNYLSGLFGVEMHFASIGPFTYGDGQVINPCPYQSDSGAMQMLCGNPRENMANFAHVVYGSYLILSLLVTYMFYKISSMIFKTVQQKKK